MSFDIIFHPEAEEEYVAGFDLYEKEKTGLGLQFEEAVYQQLHNIMLHPEVFGYSRGLYREAKIPKFSYTIVFKVNPKKNLVYISAIYHTKRNPRKKYRK